MLLIDHFRVFKFSCPQKFCALSPSVSISYPSTTCRQKPTTDFVYDSDFSEASTYSYSESTDEDITMDLAKTDEIYSHRPRFRSGYFEWYCPVCDYAIDLLDLQKVSTKSCSVTDGQNMRGITWAFSKDEDVQTTFFDTVKDHFSVHASYVESSQEIFRSHTKQTWLNTKS